MAGYPPVSQSVPSSRVELHISCKGLRKADALSKSDPLVAVYTLSATKAWTEVRVYSGATDVLDTFYGMTVCCRETCMSPLVVSCPSGTVWQAVLV